MDNSTWEFIRQSYLRWPESKATPVSAAEFDRAMEKFAPSFDADYREFVLCYGGGFVGSAPIYGLRKTEWMGTIDGKCLAPDITQLFRDQRWPGIDDWLIFSVDHGGNPIGFSKDGTVWISDQMDFQQIIQIAGGFEDYLLKWCLKTKDVS